MLSNLKENIRRRDFKVKIMIKPVLMSMVSDYTPDSSSGKVLACSCAVWLMGEGMEGMGTKSSRHGGITILR